MFTRTWLLWAGLMAIGCKRPPPAISFYYWKTSYGPSMADSAVLAENQVKELYLRYFDLDIPPSEKQPALLAAVRFIQPPDSSLHIIPVIYIRNRVFTGTADSLAPRLAVQTAAAVRQISETAGVHHREIQVDCDWTLQTRDRYFRFLRAFREATGCPLSATIRLHQVKYPVRSGIPPVDRGVLMYYNMGRIADIPENSIYDEKTAARYAASIPAYPLPMDLALPIFSWGIQLRNGKVVNLLNKMNMAGFSDPAMFVKDGDHRFNVRKAGFRAGYYFQENDVVKIEQVSSASLRAIAAGIRSNPQHPFAKLLFYDLDSANYNRYEKTIFKDIAAALH